MALLAALLLCVPTGEERLEPPATRAVIVGVLEWQAELASYSKRNRKDRELHELLLARGVPAANVALLQDGAATLASVRAAVEREARATEAGATLIVYYAGHGMTNGSDFCFANHDLDLRRLGATGWSLRELGETLAREFRGGRVLLFADCCYSGGLARVVERLAAAGIPAASVTSASSANTSTDNWTFTQSLIDALNGEPLVDADVDGSITLAELDAEVEGAMRHLEGQLHGFATSGVPADFVLAATAGPRPVAEHAPFPLGSYVMVTDARGRRAGRLIGHAGDVCTVQLYDYSDKRSVVRRCSELELSTRTARPAPSALDVGLEPDCEVEWRGTWWAARVLERKDGRYRIHYVGYEASWDEWVGADRIRFPARDSKRR